MNRVLFEVSYIGSPRAFLQVVIFVVMGLVVLIGSAKQKRSINTKIPYFLYKIEHVLDGFLVICFSLVVFGLIIAYGNVIIGYKLGEYHEVEGVVENYEKHTKTETFTVDNVEFKSGSAILSWGYIWQSDGESVITGDGQHLKIRYIPVTNVIVYIEEIADEEREECLFGARDK